MVVSPPERIPGIRHKGSNQTALAPCPGSQCRQLPVLLPVLLSLKQAEMPAWLGVCCLLVPATTACQKYSSKM